MYQWHELQVSASCAVLTLTPQRYLEVRLGMTLAASYAAVRMYQCF